MGSCAWKLLGKPSSADASDSPVVPDEAEGLRVCSSLKVYVWKVLSWIRLASMNQKPVLMLWRPLSQLRLGVKLQFGFWRGAAPRMPKLPLVPLPPLQLLKVASRPLYLST